MLPGSSDREMLDAFPGDEGTLMADPGPKAPVKTGVMGCEMPRSMSDDKDGDACRSRRPERSDSDGLGVRLRLQTRLRVRGSISTDSRAESRSASVVMKQLSAVPGALGNKTSGSALRVPRLPDASAGAGTGLILDESSPAIIRQYSLPLERPKQRPGVYLGEGME